MAEHLTKRPADRPSSAARARLKTTAACAPTRVLNWESTDDRETASADRSVAAAVGLDRLRGGTARASCSSHAEAFLKLLRLHAPLRPIATGSSRRDLRRGGDSLMGRFQPTGCTPSRSPRSRRRTFPTRPGSSALRGRWRTPTGSAVAARRLPGAVAGGTGGSTADGRRFASTSWSGGHSGPGRGPAADQLALLPSARALGATDRVLQPGVAGARLGGHRSRRWVAALCDRDSWSGRGSGTSAARSARSRSGSCGTGPPSPMPGRAPRRLSPASF